MNERQFSQMRRYFTGTVTIGIVSLLAWNYFHGGIPAHHLLANPDLPKVSNGWGGLLLPALTWFLLYRTQKRIFKEKEREKSAGKFITAYQSFMAALLFGITLVVFFSFGFQTGTDYLVMALLPVALLMPIYRAEFMLGLIIAMTYTFGAVLPTAFASFVALSGAIIYWLPRWIGSFFKTT